MKDYGFTLKLSEPKNIEVYKNDLRLKRESYHKRTKAQKNSKREKVKYLSSRSLKRLAFVASNTDVKFLTMITLTYPREYITDGTIVKSHLNTFLTWLRKRYTFLSYLWFLEFQKRGAPHYHILVNVPFIDRLAIAEEWSKIVTGGEDEDHLKAGTRVERIRKPDGARRYAVKYAMKQEQKTVPDDYEDVGRFWGHSRDVKPKILHVVDVDGMETVIVLLSKWDYVHVLEYDAIISVLYNASALLVERLGL